MCGSQVEDDPKSPALRKLKVKRCTLNDSLRSLYGRRVVRRVIDVGHLV